MPASTRPEMHYNPSPGTPRLSAHRWRGLQGRSDCVGELELLGQHPRGFPSSRSVHLVGKGAIRHAYPVHSGVDRIRDHTDTAGVAPPQASVRSVRYGPT